MSIDNGPTAAEMNLDQGTIATKPNTAPGEGTAQPTPASENPTPTPSEAIRDGSTAEEHDKTTAPQPTEATNTEQADSEKPKNEAEKAAESIMAGRIQEIRRKIDAKEPTTTEERILVSIDTYRSKGLGEDYERDGGVIPIPTEFQVNGVKVTAIIGQETRDNKKFYTCTVEGHSKPTMEISGDDFASAHMAINVAEISSNFKGKDAEGKPTADTPQSQLVEWYANGAKGDPPASAAELIKGENDPLHKAGRVIQDNINNLRREINNAAAGADLDPQRRLIAQLEAAQLLAKSDIKNLAIVGALNSLGEGRMPRLNEILTSLKPGMEAEYAQLESKLLEAGLTNPQLELIKTEGLKLIGENYIDLVAKLAGMEGWEKILPDDVTPEQFMTKLEATLPPGQKEWWDTNKGKLGKGAWTALLILLAVPAVAMGAAVAAVSTAAGAGGRQ